MAHPPQWVFSRQSHEVWMTEQEQVELLFQTTRSPLFLAARAPFVLFAFPRISSTYCAALFSSSNSRLTLSCGVQLVLRCLEFQIFTPGCRRPNRGAKHPSRATSLDRRAPNCV